MYLSFSLLIVGALILASTLWRAQHITNFSDLSRRLEQVYDTSDLDLSGDTSYTDCLSHSWILENVSQRKHSSIGERFQRQFMDNTLTTFIVVALLLGIAGMFIGLLFVLASQAAGSAALIILLGVAIVFGPGEPKTSEELGNYLLEQDIEDLKKQDYVYLKIAISSVKKWSNISLVIGIIFIALAPISDSIPAAVATLIALFAGYVLLGPAMALAEFSVALSILYLAFVPIVILIVIPRTLYVYVTQKRQT